MLPSKLKLRPYRSKGVLLAVLFFYTTFAFFFTITDLLPSGDFRGMIIAVVGIGIFLLLLWFYTKGLDYKKIPTQRERRYEGSWSLFIAGIALGLTGGILVEIFVEKKEIVWKIVGFLSSLLFIYPLMVVSIKQLQLEYEERIREQS